MSRAAGIVLGLAIGCGLAGGDLGEGGRGEGGRERKQDQLAQDEVSGWTGTHRQSMADRSCSVQFL